jgi:hypothetical protein
MDYLVRHVSVLFLCIMKTVVFMKDCVYFAS